MNEVTNEAVQETTAQAKPLKLNYKRTFTIGFAFFGILLLWQVYDTWCPTFLTELFKTAFNKSESADVQYLVGVMMALDNLAALILLPIFGKLSDKTKSPMGKRMPYILVGTFICSVTFPFIPVFFHQNNLAGTIAMMAIVLIFAMMYRNPAVALMPDMTPKPLRSKANGIINIMGYIGGAFATVVGMVFILTDYLGTSKTIKFPWQTGNIWAIEAPFLVGSVLMLISAVVLMLTIKENKIAEEVKEDMARGEEESEAADKMAVDDEGPMTPANKRMLFFILAAEFFWFMADNGIGTFLNNFVIYKIIAKSSDTSLMIIISGVGSIIGFVTGGMIASKIGRKWTILAGLGATLISYIVWVILTFAVGYSGSVPVWLYIIWFVKGVGMSLVHVNSYPMVVELCSSKKIGAFTGYYYASSMAAQTVTPILLGLLLLVSDKFEWNILPIYATICLVASTAIFFFVKNVGSRKTEFKKGLEALDVDD